MGAGMRSTIGRRAIVPLWLLEADISMHAKLLFAILDAKYADRDGEAIPSRGLLAKDLGASRDTVDKAKSELVRIGALTTHERRDMAGDHTSNLYVLHHEGPLHSGGVAAPQRPPGGRPTAAQNPEGTSEPRYVAVSTKPPRAPRQTSDEIGRAAGRVIAAYSRYCRDHSVPTPSRSDIAIMSAQARNLLVGSFAERDITEEALIVASEFDLVHGHRGMTQLQRRVQERYEDARIAEHERVIAESREIAPDVAAAMGEPLKDVPSNLPHDPRPPRPIQRQPESPGDRCEACRHFAIEHTPEKCAACELIGRKCAA